MSDPRLPADEEVLKRIASFPKTMTLLDGQVVPMLHCDTPEWEASQKAAKENPQ